MINPDAENNNSDDDASRGLDERVRRAVGRLVGDEISIESADQLRDYLATLLVHTDCAAENCDLDAMTRLVEGLDAENDEHDGIQFSMKYKGRIWTHFNVEKEKR